ncbi:MAG: histidine kinase, partial [Bdellovibrionia bacterium]
MQALAASYKLLRTDLDDGVDVGDLVRSQLAHLEGLIGNRIFITGEGLRLRPGAMEVIGMALHELATNAGKYGALSTDRGEVHIRWSSDATTFHFSWVERHGPPPRPPNRRG